MKKLVVEILCHLMHDERCVVVVPNTTLLDDLFIRVADLARDAGYSVISKPSSVENDHTIICGYAVDNIPEGIDSPRILVMNPLGYSSVQFNRILRIKPEVLELF